MGKVEQTIIKKVFKAFEEEVFGSPMDSSVIWTVEERGEYDNYHRTSEVLQSWIKLLMRLRELGLVEEEAIHDALKIIG